MSDDQPPSQAVGQVPAEAATEDSLQQQSGIIAWDELARHFARGVVVTVSPRLDLLAVAQRFADDDTQSIEQWLKDADLARASDDDARSWVARSPQFRCVVVAPWVLVQELH